MKRFTIILVLLCAITLIGCHASSKGETKPIQSECEYIITDADYQHIICPLIITSYWCESMRNALQEYDSDLYTNAIDPEHDCLNCKVKALKFFYESDDWADTTGETWEAEDFETLLNTNVKFKALWDSIEL